MKNEVKEEPRDFHAELMLVWANDGPEAAKALLNGLEKNDLREAYSSLFMKYFELAVENDRIIKELWRLRYGN